LFHFVGDQENSASFIKLQSVLEVNQ